MCPFFISSLMAHSSFQRDWAEVKNKYGTAIVSGLFSCADLALYRAKAGGRNRVEAAAE